MLLLLLLVLVVRAASGFECEFPDRRCGWRWSDAWTLLTAENTSALGQTAPESDAENNVKGELLYFSPDTAGSQSILKVSSPLFEANTLPTCAIRFALHMYQMDEAVFKMVIKAPNSTWESTAFSGNSHHKWENQTQPINVVTQPFSVMIEILNPSSAYPAHVAIDNIEPVDCYHERSTTTDCTPRQFQCDDLICVDAAQVCDLYPDCIEGEDEDQDCDKIPASAYCTFERNVCGWNTSFNDNSNWIQRRGLSPNSRTGPSSDHTFQNSTGTYMVAKFPSGRVFGFQTTFTSPWFMPPPYYHRNVHSPFYNSCQVRFFYHKFGHGVGDLRLYSLEADPANDKVRPMELWRSYGNKGDTWWKAIVTLPNISHPFQLEFLAVRGTGNSDIAIDDVSLSPECFGIGVPESESRVPPPKLPKVQKKGPIKYIFNTCGAEGRIGPTQSDCFSAYRNSITKIEMMEDKVDMKGIQKWTVPQKGLYTLFVKGAGGGPGVENRGKSLGTSLRATFEWEEGQALYILVGQKGVDACRQMKERCDADIGGMVKRSIESLRVFNNQRKTGGAGGGGGATYVFQMEGLSRQKVPLAIAGGGGGLASRKELNEAFVVPHGLMPNNSILPINGYTGSAAGGGGGWDDKTSSNMSGMSLREGGRGGEACDKTADYWNATGGFGGGGGSCLSGGGGGGYRGGDASDAENNDASYNGQGGTSYLMPGSIRVLVEPGSNPGDGSVVIMPAQKGCGCEHLCVYLDVENKAYYCICPPPLTLSIDGFSCDGNTGVNVSPKILIIIIIAVVITISVVTICILFATARYRKLQRSRDVSNQPLNSPDEQLSRLRNVGGMVSENNPNYEFGGNTWSEQDLKKIPRENLTLLHGLGQGAFGEVYEGTLKNTDDNEETPVAVKTLPEISSNQAVFDFLMEALIMSKFNHPNIVSFIGVCFDKMPRFIILELLQGGDLKSFLRECRPKPNVRSSLTITDLLKLAVDVAHGCQYLEENHFIHRDIAARNCLLTTKDADRVVKIADFGMARDIYRADYYRKGGKAMLPIKWMPPEAFLDGVFTTKTDVWSYGILLWELISLGYMPYPGRGNQEVMQLIMSGGRLEPPTNCPSPIYHIMMQCWHPHPDERPNFTTIIERLGYCMQDPDVINSELPVFRQAPSMERDATVMRPQEMDKAAILQVKVQRQDPGLLLSPGSEDYLIPTPHSSYSLNTEVMSGDSADQLLEMEERGGTPSSRPPSVWETNFMTPETPTEPPGWGSSNCIQAATEEGDVSKPSIASKHSQQNGQIKGMDRASSSSLDDLPLAPELGTPKQPLDPSALLDSAPQRAPYGDLGCAPRTTFDGFSGVNPVA